jgi:hypothetical protein
MPSAHVGRFLCFLLQLALTMHRRVRFCFGAPCRVGCSAFVASWGAVGVRDSRSDHCSKPFSCRWLRESNHALPQDTELDWPPCNPCSSSWSSERPLGCIRSVCPSDLLQPLSASAMVRTAWRTVCSAAWRSPLGPPWCPRRGMVTHGTLQWRRALRRSLPYAQAPGCSGCTDSPLCQVSCRV